MALARSTNNQSAAPTRARSSEDKIYTYQIRRENNGISIDFVIDGIPNYYLKRSVVLQPTQDQSGTVSKQRIRTEAKQLAEKMANAAAVAYLTKNFAIESLDIELIADSEIITYQYYFDQLSTGEITVNDIAWIQQEECNNLLDPVIIGLQMDGLCSFKTAKAFLPETRALINTHAQLSDWLSAKLLRADELNGHSQAELEARVFARRLLGLAQQNPYQIQAYDYESDDNIMTFEIDNMPLLMQDFLDVTEDDSLDYALEMQEMVSKELVSSLRNQIESMLNSPANASDKKHLYLSLLAIIPTEDAANAVIWRNVLTKLVTTAATILGALDSAVFLAAPAVASSNSAFTLFANKTNSADGYDNLRCLCQGLLSIAEFNDVIKMDNVAHTGHQQCRF